MKKFVLLKRKDRLSAKAFSDYWRTHHGPLVLQLPEFSAFTATYVQNHLRPTARSETIDVWDGLVETTQREREDYSVGFADTQAYEDKVRPDERRFMNVDVSGFAMHELTVVIDGPAEGIKYLAFLKRSPHLTHEAFLRAWQVGHADLVSKVSDFSSRIRRYVQHRPVPIVGGLGKQPFTWPYDGITELWFESETAALQGFASPNFAPIRADELRFIAQPVDRFWSDEVHFPIPQPS